MKKLLLASAVAALSVSAANAAPTLYGKAHLSINAVDADNSNTSVTLRSHSSRIGLKGSEGLTANTDLVYKLEYGINIDDQNNSQFTSRETYVGLNNANMGMFTVGNQNSVTDIVNNVTQAAAGASGTSSELADGERVGNSLVWTAPEGYNLPVELSLMATTDENYGDGGIGGAIVFDQGTGFTAGLAYAKDLDIDGDVFRASATMDMSDMMAMPLALGVLYQQAEEDKTGSEQEQEIIVSAAYDIVNTPWTAWAEYDMVDDLGGVKNSDRTRIAIGGDYKFNAATTAHVYGAIVNTEVSGKDSDTNIVGTSLEYKF